MEPRELEAPGKASTAGHWWVGTSGWQYADWRGRLYPAKLPQRLWLEHYVQHFATVEVNNAFYRLPERRGFWAGGGRGPPGALLPGEAGAGPAPPQPAAPPRA